MSEQEAQTVVEEAAVESGQQIVNLEVFGRFIHQWHGLCETKLQTIISNPDMRILLQEADGTEVEASKETAYGFIRGLMHALEVFDLPFSLQEVDEPTETIQ